MRQGLRRLVRDHTDISSQIQPYGLRLSFITLCLDAGVSERDLASYVGQRDTTTMPVYDQLRVRVSLDRAPTHTLEAYLTRAEAVA